MSDYPKTCATCGARRDSHDAAFRDWEAARGPLEAQLAEARALLVEVERRLRANLDERAWQMAPEIRVFLSRTQANAPGHVRPEASTQSAEGGRER